MPPAETLKTKIQPNITAEGQKAKDSIAAARAKRTAGTITPSDLEPTPAMKVTQPEPSTAGAGLTGAIDSFTQNQVTDVATKGTNADASRTAYVNAEANRQGKSALQLAADEANGVNDANASLNGINEQILAQKNALNQQTQAIMKAGGTSKAQAQAQINNITREANANLANLSITQFVAQNRYDSAKAIADRAVDAQFDQEQKQIDALKFTYEDNRDLFTTAEQRLFETKLEDRRTAVEAARVDKKEIYDLALAAIQAGAPSSILDQATKSGSKEAALAIVQPYLAPKAKASSAPDVKNFGTADAPIWKQWNPQTASWEDAIDPVASTSTNNPVQKTLDQISFLKTTISDAEGLVGATGPNLVTKGLGNFFVGNTKVKQLANKVDTLKTNLLTLNSDPALKKFFGPQMTEKDTQLLMSAGSTLNAYDSSEEDNKAELTRYSDLLNRMETAVKQGQAATRPPVLLTGKDGLTYQIIDPE